MTTEENFPRGGRKPTKHVLSRLHKNLFSTTSKKTVKAKIRKSKPTNNIGTLDKTFYSTKAETLSYSRIQEDMLILGRIRNVYEISFDVSLPGKIYGTVQIQNISTTYSKLIKEFLTNSTDVKAADLSDLFLPGQYIPVKVVEKKVNDKNSTKLFLSTKPADINKEISYSCITKKMFLWGAISEKEDHGYLVELGIPNTRAFLPNCNINEDKTYLPGQNIWCIVSKVDISSTVTTIQLSTIVEDINKLFLQKELNLNNIIPGSKLGVTVDKILKYGLQVKVSDGITGYITETQLKHPFDKVSNYKVGDFIHCRLLYVMPVTKFCYLSLYELDSNDYEANKTLFKFGDSCFAKVISKTSGINVTLNDDVAKGYVSYRRLKRKESKEKKDLLESLEKLYPINSLHKTRIVEYIPMERMYICSLEEEFVKETIFTVEDLKYAEIYTSTIVEVCINGVRVKIGKLFGFILNNHLSDITLSFEAIRKKFKINSPLKVRVWKLRTNNNRLLLTARPSLLDAKDCLSSIEDAKPNTEVTGIVSAITQSGFLIGFYDEMKGWLPLTNCGESYDKSSFYIGQTVKSTILYLDSTKKVILTFAEPKLPKRRRLYLGQKVDANVKKVIDNVGIEVIIPPNGINALIPASHLSNSTSLCNIILETYSVGDLIEDLICIENLPKNILSLRESHLYREENRKIPKFEDLYIGFITRCSFHSINENGLLLSTPISNYNKRIIVDLKNITDEKLVNWNNYNLSPGQPMLVKIIHIDEEQKIIFGDTKLSSVYNFDVDRTINYMGEYFGDLKRIQSHFASKGNPIANYFPGQHVKVLVKQVLKENDEMHMLELNDGLQAFSRKSTSKRNVGNVGETLEAVVLWVHYNMLSVEVSLNPNIIKQVNKKQSESLALPIESEEQVQVLLARKDMDVAIAVLKKSAKRQLVFLPTMCSENDWFSKICLPFTEENTKMKIIIKRISPNGQMIGISKQMVTIFKNRHKIFAPIKRIPKSATKKKRNISSIVSEKFVDETEENDSETEKINDDVFVEKDNAELAIKANTGCVASEEPSKKKSKREFKDVNFRHFTSEQDNLIIESDEKPRLPGVQGFYNELNENEANASSDSENECKEINENIKKKKLSPYERAELAKIEEGRIRQRENELLDLPKNPQNPDQFERLILANPNNSELWIKYISYYIMLTEIDKARAVIKKALDAILFKEEQEIFNIWMAWLNLENNYGTKESFDAVLKDAIRYNDALEVNLNVLEILAQSGKTAEFETKARSLLKNKEFKCQSKLWLTVARCFFSLNLVEKARSICMQQCKDSLSKNDHFNLMVQFALLEFTQENTEYGESLFQHIILSCPHRVDVWCTYVDQFIKKNRPDLARNVLERAAAQKLPVKKMKTIFKKYLEFEKKYGDEELQIKVKDMAQKFVNNIS